MSNPQSALRNPKSVHADAPRLVGTCRTPGDAHGISVDRGYAFVASFGEGLQIADVSDPTRPTPLASLGRKGYVSQHFAKRIYVEGNHAYVANAKGGLWIVDISDPSEPVTVSMYPTPDWALGVWVADGYAYVATHWTGVRVLDVSDPSKPVEVGAYDTTGSAHTLWLDGDLFYVADKYSLVILRKRSNVR